MNISASMYPIIPLLRYRYIIFIIRRQCLARDGPRVGEKKRPRRRSPPFFLQQLEEKEPIRTREGVEGEERWGGFLTLARSLAGLSISGLGGNFSSLWRIITESFPHRVASAINDLHPPLLPSKDHRRMDSRSTMRHRCENIKKKKKKLHNEIFRTDFRSSRFFPLRSCFSENH